MHNKNVNLHAYSGHNNNSIQLYNHLWLRSMNIFQFTSLLCLLVANSIKHPHIIITAYILLVCFVKFKMCTLYKLHACTKNSFKDNYKDDT